jgi:hypothetical protein
MFGEEGRSSGLSPSRGMIWTAFGKMSVHGSSRVSRTMSSRFLRDSRTVNILCLDAFPSACRVIRPSSSSGSCEPHLRAQRRRVSMCSARRRSDHGVCGRGKGVETKRGPWSSSIDAESTSVPLPTEWASERFGPVEKTAGRAAVGRSLRCILGERHTLGRRASPRAPDGARASTASDAPPPARAPGRGLSALASSPRASSLRAPPRRVSAPPPPAVSDRLKDTHTPRGGRLGGCRRARARRSRASRARRRDVT